jgi:hypothetical protein
MMLMTRRKKDTITVLVRYVTPLIYKNIAQRLLLTKIMTEQARSKKSRKKVKSTKTDDLDAVMSMIDDPIGRKVMLGGAVSCFFILAYLLSMEMMFIISGTFVIVGVFAFSMLHYGCGVDIKRLVHTLLYSERAMKVK